MSASDGPQSRSPKPGRASADGCPGGGDPSGGAGDGPVADAPAELLKARDDRRVRAQPVVTGGHDVRRGLVLGGGGVLGFAWMVGALRVLEDEEGFDARGVDICVGTSAGSILAALIGMHVGVDAILRHQQGIPLPADPRIDWDHRTDTGGPLPPRPNFGVGSPDLLRRAARHPSRVPPLVAASALLPRGRGTLEPVHRMIEGLSFALLDGGRRTRSADATSPWPRRPQTWIVTIDYRSGRRVVLGRAGAPRASIADAVQASCAIPAWYPPVMIEGRPYVDGGTWSPASADLLVDAGLDEV